MSPSVPTPRLLVVDDEPDLRTLYELTLVREGYDVDCAGSVTEVRPWLYRPASKTQDFTWALAMGRS